VIEHAKATEDRNRVTAAEEVRGESRTRKGRPVYEQHSNARIAQQRSHGRARNACSDDDDVNTLGRCHALGHDLILSLRRRGRQTALRAVSRYEPNSVVGEHSRTLAQATSVPAEQKEGLSGSEPPPRGSPTAEPGLLPALQPCGSGFGPYRLDGPAASQRGNSPNRRPAAVGDC
jgi:hypothetical protein